MRTRSFLPILLALTCPVGAALGQVPQGPGMPATLPNAAEYSRVACEDFKAARNGAEFDAAHAKHVRPITAEILRLQSEINGDELSRRAQARLADQASLKKAETRLSTLSSSSPSDAELETAAKDAKTRLDEITGDESKLAELQRQLSEGVVSGVGAAERKTLEAEIEALKSKVGQANKPAAAQAAQRTQGALKGRQDALKELRAEVGKLKQAAAKSAESYKQEATKQAGLEKRKKAVEDYSRELIKHGMVECHKNKAKELQGSPETPGRGLLDDLLDPKKPGSQEKGPAPPEKKDPIDDLLGSIERDLNTAQTLIAKKGPRCAEIDAAAVKARAEADKLAADADALAGQASAGGATGAAGAQAAAGQKAVNDATAAASAIGPSRNRAQQLTQAACAASRQVMADPRSTNAPGLLAEAQRTRALAEQEVTVTANALQQIRTAYAAAPEAAAPGATTAPGGPAGLQAQLAALRTRQASLNGQPASLRGQASAVSQADAQEINAALEVAQQTLVGAAGLPGVGGSERVTRLVERFRRLSASKSCAPASLAALDTRLTAASTKVQQAQTAVAGATPSGAANYRQAIEGIFNTARATAEGTGNDATAAVRCASEAQNAVATAAARPPAPPPPPRPPSPPTAGGIKCTYTGPQGPYEVILYNVTTCPTTVPGNLATQTPAGPPPQMMQDFSGTWTEGPWVYQISATGLSGTKGKTGDSASGSCQQTGTHVLSCKGTGVYNDDDKETHYTFTAELRLSGNSISYTWLITGHNRRMKRAIPDYGDLQKGKVYNGTLTRGR